MSNLIQNGDFAWAFAGWVNPVLGGLAFLISAEQPFGVSNPSSVATKTYKMCQPFSLNDEIITATITVWAIWEAYSGDDDGSNRFLVELEKPDTTMVTLVDTTKTAAVSSGNILTASDISANFSTYGNYKLWLTLVSKSSKTGVEHEVSEGGYDNISIDVTVKKYKAVHEMIGSLGVLDDKVTISPPAYNYESASEVVGLSESCSYIVITDSLGVSEVVGLSESIQAKRTQGNLETTYVLEDLTQWTEISRVTTPWVKEKIVIN